MSPTSPFLMGGTSRRTLIFNNVTQPSLAPAILPCSALHWHTRTTTYASHPALQCPTLAYPHYNICQPSCPAVPYTGIPAHTAYASHPALQCPTLAYPPLQLCQPSCPAVPYTGIPISTAMPAIQQCNAVHWHDRPYNL